MVTPTAMLPVVAETKNLRAIYKLSITQPEWTKDPNANILLFSWGGIVNPENQDMIFLNMDRPHWVDNNHIEFYSLDGADSLQAGRKKYILDLVNWQILNADAEESNKKIEVESRTLPVLRISGEDENTPIEIYNSEGWGKFLYPPEGLYNLNFEYISGRVFVVQGQERWGDGILIRIYDFETKEILKTYSGKINKGILQIVDGKVLYVTEHTICFISTDYLEKTCGARLPENLNNIAIGWDIDFPETIPFSYEDPVEENFFSRKLCLANFYEGDLKCPMEGLQIFEPKINIVKNPDYPNGEEKIIETMQVLGYLISQDRKQIVFCYGNSAYARYEGTVLINFDGSNFNRLDDIDPLFRLTFARNCQYSFRNLEVNWRPAP